MEGNIELNTAWEFVEKTGKSVFLTGKAGTGKTTFLKRVVEESKKRVVVVAPTGIAAINAGGVTIHSFFQLPLHPFIPGMKIESKFAFSKEKRSIIKTIDILIIDEISMVRSDLLDAIDSVLRRFRNRHKPFGGVQLLMIGDLQQLSPVVTDEDVQFLSQYYPSPYFFGSHALARTDYVTIELKEVYRQQDAVFISMLNAVRGGRPSIEVIRALNSRYCPGFVPPPDEGYIRLTTHNHIADEYNSRQLSLIDDQAHSFEAEVSGNFPESSYPVDFRLELKAGAQVMFVKNDPSSDKRYYNGKIGIVTDFYEEYIMVQCPGEDEKIAVEPLEWENSRYVINEQTQEMESEVIGIFRQYPLRLAWAITIHKSQGLTFDKAIIDAASAFASGQVYVALSRCRTLEGMVLATPLRQDAVITDLRVEDYIEGQEAAAVRSLSRLDSIKEEYYKELLGELFDFNELASLQKRMLGVCKDFPSGSVVGLAQKHNDILNDLGEMVVPVGIKWQKIIAQKPFEEIVSSEFRLRIRNGCSYFLEQINTAYGDFLEKTADIKAENKELIKRYGNIWNDLDFELKVIRNLLKAMSVQDFTTDDYLRERQIAVYEASDFVPKQLKTPKKTGRTSEKKPVKEKKEDTKVTTFKLYKQGHSIKEIAKERDLNQQTIVRHLAHYVAKGMLAVEEFVPEAKVDAVREAVESLGSPKGLAAIKEACPEDVTYQDIVLVIAGMENG
ncbi:MAG: helix-turn-helix domain-containing protein [Bacteroidales bacterium]|nr:helix-turn-helix domain-containing protein [Bacteroidales bacterium]